MLTPVIRQVLVPWSLLPLATYLLRIQGKMHCPCLNRDKSMASHTLSALAASSSGTQRILRPTQQSSLYRMNPDGTIVVNGQTLNLATPTSVTLPGGKVVTIGPNGISFDGTVIPFPAGLAAAMPTAMTVAGIAFSVGPGEVIIGGKTYSF